jgi:hypothetical protein
MFNRAISVLLLNAGHYETEQVARTDYWAEALSMQEVAVLCSVDLVVPSK